MQTREEALEYGLSFPYTYKEAPFHDKNWQLVRVEGSKKAFLWIYEKDGYINLNVKTDPNWRDYWRDAFESVIPGWHQNKEHWNTIILDGTVPDDAIRTMIAESYEIITDNPAKRIYDAVKKVPKGKVATYGQIAQMAGNKRMARAVGNALHKNPDPGQYTVFTVSYKIQRVSLPQNLLLEEQESRQNCLKLTVLKLRAVRWIWQFMVLIWIENYHVICYYINMLSKYLRKEQ